MLGKRGLLYLFSLRLSPQSLGLRLPAGITTSLVYLVELLLLTM